MQRHKILSDPTLWIEETKCSNGHPKTLIDQRKKAGHVNLELMGDLVGNLILKARLYSGKAEGSYCFAIT